MADQKLSRISLEEMTMLNDSIKAIFDNNAEDEPPQINDGNLQALAQSSGWIDAKLTIGDVSMIFASTKLGKKKTLKF
jgi:hypothetical protein